MQFLFGYIVGMLSMYSIINYFLKKASKEKLDNNKN
jgi:hypothetical protein